MMHHQGIPGWALAALIWSILWVDAAPVVHTYTDPSAFLAAVSGEVVEQGFEALAAGTPLPGGSEVDGITLDSVSGGLVMKVVDRFNQSTVGGVNSLGLMAADEAFLSGDSVIFEWDRPMAGFGIMVIGSPGDVRPGDITLYASSTNVSNGSTSAVMLPDGGEMYFLGVYVEDADAVSAFSSAVLTSQDPGEEGLFVFNVDDATYRAADNGTDTDGDGLTDWEESYVFGTEKENPDTDSDGARDGDEILAGTDPKNVHDVFAVTRIDEAKGDMILRWSSVHNRTYSVMIRTNLFHGAGSILESNITANPPENSYTAVPPASVKRRYYFITVKPPSP